ncbi:FtsW/RodA/SpoVE family cell cycle protein [Domibacillus enclensis]|uniref:Probable peptidoglycan glycosyltransferase FtsW n=1 Tax=Domibacillus enclensis TaxID=1017273 RepID=A0A1N6U5W8_9BACI|nr:FtsW/RodA/SpoVE family cell cycle protein [Domibacillus enclensis]OXS78441.1 cell division protein FtsW [Domibacillus enclensis]SIQ60970.1 cell division-specific peptidoglycan biosynthesis regulator FtsW [Domibacillus enclensis]
MWKRKLKSYDYPLAAVFVLLCLFGLMMIFSASSVMAVQRWGYESGFFYDKQKLHIAAAFIAFGVMSFFPYQRLKARRFLLLLTGGMVATLLMLFLFGSVAGNAQSWFKVGARSIQPSEFSKLVIIIYMAAVFSKKQKNINSLNYSIAPPMILLFGVCFLVAVQPDFGTAAIIFAIGLTIVLASGIKMKKLAKFALLIGIVLVLMSPLFIWQKDNILSEEQMSRLTSYLDPFKYEEGDGYHLVNSYLAIGSGGLTGRGLGQSIQKLGYLPEPHTDFIMAVIAEELGVIGVFLVIGGLSFIILHGLKVAMRCKDSFGSMLAVGISSMLGIQAFINLGGVSGVIPITGVPLPFISYGGSSLLLLSISLGILANVSMQTKHDKTVKL